MLAVPVESVVVGRVPLRAAFARVALLGHLALEAGEVDVDAALAGDLLRQLERESVRVVQQERGGAGQLPDVAGSASSSSRIDETGLQRLAEALLLAG